MWPPGRHKVESVVLPTKVKLQIARLLNRLIVGGRTLVGLPPTVRVRRNGSLWELDLNEGVDLAIYLGLYQRFPEEILRSELRPGESAIDIGANIGAHTLTLARAVGAGGQVVAVEPTAYAFQKLKKNLELNETLADHVIAVQCALNDGAATLVSGTQFYSRWPLNETGGALHAEHMGKYESAGGARFVALDDLMHELRSEGRMRGTIAFVKLDVDGHELVVLKGAQKLLTDDRPVILMEVAPHVQDEVPDRFEALVEMLHQFGYRFESAVDGKPLPDSAVGLRTMIPFGASIDAIVRPVE
jgi:FkbM family methyltransferase